MNEIIMVIGKLCVVIILGLVLVFLVCIITLMILDVCEKVIDTITEIKRKKDIEG